MIRTNLYVLILISFHFLPFTEVVPLMVRLCASHLYPPPPSGPRNSGSFYFSIFKALLKDLHCGAKFVVKSLLNAPSPGVDNNDYQQMTLIILNKLSISPPPPPSPMVVSHETLQLAKWFQRIYKYIVQSITQKYKRYRLETSLVDICR